jgi:amino acid transporter
MTEQASSTPAARDAGSGASFYTRQASGLVRDISPASSIALNVSFVSIPLAVLIATQAPAAFPGASPFWVAVICAVLCIFPVLLYSLFTSVMPRSGGDYVFVSRTLHPWAGFAASFNITAWYLLVIAYFAYLLTPFGLSSAFSTIGVAAGSSTFSDLAVDVNTKGWQFAIGAVALISVALLMSLSLRSALRIYKWLFAFSLVGVAVSALLLLFNGRDDFVQAVSAFGGDYDQVVADARAAGFAGSANFDLGNTLLAMPLAFASFGYAIVTAYAGGEIRSPKGGNRTAMVLSLGIAAVIVAVLMALASRTFGNDFLGSATYLGNAGAETYPFEAAPFFFFFVSMLTGSTPLIVLISLSFIVAFLVALPATFLIATRNIFAWSFDRVLPERLSEVSERTRSPLIANGVVLLVTLGYLALIVFAGGDFLDLLFTAGLAELLTFMVVAIAGIAFPAARRAVYESSPIRRSAAGVPLLAVVGACALAVYGFFFYSLATTDELGANASPGIRATVIIAAVSLLIYPIAVLLNRSRGVNLGLAFRELPPE